MPENTEADSKPISPRTYSPEELAFITSTRNLPTIDELQKVNARLAEALKSFNGVPIPQTFNWERPLLKQKVDLLGQIERKCSLLESQMRVSISG